MRFCLFKLRIQYTSLVYLNMEGGLAQSGGRNYEGKPTTLVIVTCLVAATGGLIFGYDIGITGLFSFSMPFCIQCLNLFFFF